MLFHVNSKTCQQCYHIRIGSCKSWTSFTVVYVHIYFVTFSIHVLKSTGLFRKNVDTFCFDFVFWVSFSVYMYVQIIFEKLVISLYFSSTFSLYYCSRIETWYDLCNVLFGSLQSIYYHPVYKGTSWAPGHHHWWPFNVLIFHQIKY